MWDAVTNLGDSAVLLPLAAMLAAGLWAEGSPRLALRWLMVFGSVGAVVAASKLAYLLWAIDVPGLTFRGFSGHTALATVSYPALMWLMVRPDRMLAKQALLLAGLLMGAVIGWSRLEVQAHTVSEVAGGFVLGATAAGLFLRGQVAPLGRALTGRVSVLAGYLLCFQLGRAPTQALLLTLAGQLSAKGF